MQRCCQKLAGDIYDGILQRYNATDNPHLIELLRINSVKYPGFWKMTEIFSTIRVANLPAKMSASAALFNCRECEDPSSLVVVSAPLLLTIWRLQLLFAELIEEWTFVDSKLRVKIREPEFSEQEEFKLILDEYIAGGVVRPLDLPEVNDRINKLNPDFRDLFLEAIEIGELWVITHEMIHAMERDIGQFFPEFITVRETIARSLEDSDLPPRTQRLWTEELQADVIGAATMYRKIYEKNSNKGCSHTSDVILREESGATIAAGIASAMEAIYRIDVLFNHDTLAYDRTHPPPYFRWLTVSSYIKLLTQPRPEVDLFYLAQIIGGISQKFPHYCDASV